MPRIIWFLWFQGLDNAPDVVRKCYESWVARNPTWRVVNLDASMLSSVSRVDYSAGNIAALSQQHKADLLRLDLMANHGGVWADATCFCVQPLDDWLPQKMESGFFAFYRPGPDRILSNWFLAADPGSVLASRMFERMLHYWGNHRFVNSDRQFSVKVLTRLLRGSRRTRDWWFSPVIRDWLRLSPYFAFAYSFEKLIHEDAECAAIWSRTAKVSAAASHHLYRAGLLTPVTPELRAEINRREVPVYKTAWNLEDKPITCDTVLGYLLDMARTEG
jgi:hypothetical protein